MKNLVHTKTSGYKIGFDDRWVMIILIPIISFIIPFVFFGVRFQYPLSLTWKLYICTFIISTVIWSGNRIIMIWARKKYPNFNDVKKRLTIQFTVMLLFTLAANNLLGFLDFLVEGVWLKLKCIEDQSTVDKIINSNNASIFCSLVVTTIYESIFFKSELKRSIEEKETLKRESLSAQLDALQTQVNPHFLFNNLNTLTALIPEDADTAVNFVQQLSKVYRHILEVKDEQCVDLATELNVLKSYAFLLKTRFGDSLNINIDVAESLMQKKVIPLSLQLLMENAIKHNIVSHNKPLTIHIFASNGYLVVSNNLQLKQQVIDSTGLGLENIRNRYKLFNNLKVEIVTGPEKFIVSIPLIEH